MRKSITVAALAVTTVLTLGACSATSSGTDAGTSSAKASTKASASKSKPGKGVGSKDASKDVVVGKKATQDQYGFSSDVPVTVTNHSSKKSDYMIELAIESADGKTQYDTTTVFIQNLAPGQTKKDKGTFLEKITKAQLATAKIVVNSVERTESFN